MSVQRDRARLRVTENSAYCRLRKENQRTNTCPKAAAVSRHPEFMPNTASRKMQNPLAIPNFLAFSTQKFWQTKANYYNTA
jgi:hypothetical protein